MMPIGDKYSDMGTVVIGKVESGCAEKGQTLSIYPNRTDVKVDTLWSDDIEVTRVTCGENVKVKLKGVEESEVTPGFVLCDPNNPIKSCKTFDAQVNNSQCFKITIKVSFETTLKYFKSDFRFKCEFNLLALLHLCILFLVQHFSPICVLLRVFALFYAFL